MQQRRNHSCASHCQTVCLTVYRPYKGVHKGGRRVATTAIAMHNCCLSLALPFTASPEAAKPSACSTNRALHLQMASRHECRHKSHTQLQTVLTNPNQADLCSRSRSAVDRVARLKLLRVNARCRQARALARVRRCCATKFRQRKRGRAFCVLFWCPVPERRQTRWTSKRVRTVCAGLAMLMDSCRRGQEEEG